MMNRGVMQRQMFRNGGEASFPDLSGDGRISQKDILMGRGVQGLAMGGPPMDPNMMPPPPNMMPPPPMAPPPMPPAGAEQALMGAEAQGQQAGMMAMEGMMQDIDGAQDYESLINGLRGNDLPLDARYAELAGLVGPEDAQQTPESVLTLTQPAIMMTEEGALNSGVGELMRGIAGDVEMEGPMSEGVGGLMMAQAPEPAMQAPMMEAGNTPPVNFRQGGPVEVRGYQDGEEVKVGGGSAIDIAGRDLSKYQDFLSGGYDAQARAADLEEQRKMSQAQMLFDIAQTGLQFAGNTQGSSIAERLANAAAQTQLPQRIGERSAQMLAAKQAQTAEKRQLDMAARQAALAGGQAEVDAQLKRDLAPAPKKLAPSMHRVTLKDGTSREFDVANDLAGFNAYIKKNAALNPQSVKVGEAAKSKYKIMPVYTFGANGQLISEKGYSVDESTGDGLAEYNAALEKAGAVSGTQAEHRLALNAKIKELGVSDTISTFRILKDGKLLNGDKVVAGEVRALTSKDATALGKTGKLGPALGIQASLMEVFKPGEESKFILVDENIEATLKKLGTGWSKTPPDKGLIKLQKVGTDGTVVSKVLRKDSSTFSTDLDAALADNFMPENEAASLALRDSVAQQVEERLETTTINAEVREQADRLEIIAKEALVAASQQIAGNNFTAGQNAIQLAYDKERDAADLALRQVIEDRKLTDSKFDNIMAKAKFYDQKKQQEYSKSQDLIAQNNVEINQAFKEREVAIAEGNFDLAKKKQAEVVRLNNLNANERDRQFILAQEAQALDERSQNELGTYRTDMLLQDSLRLKATVDHQAATLAISQAELDLKQAEPNIRVVGDNVYDFTDFNTTGRPKIIAGVSARGTTTVNVNGTIVDITDPQNTQIVYQDPNSNFVIEGGSVVDMTDPNNPRVVTSIPKQAGTVIKEFDGKLLQISPEFDTKGVATGKTITVELDKNTALPKQELYNVTIGGVTTTQDFNTPAGRAYIDKANKAGGAVERLATQINRAQTFSTDPYGLVTSYDGRTFLDKEGNVRQLNAKGVNAVTVSSEIAESVKKRNMAALSATNRLLQDDAEFAVEIMPDMNENYQLTSDEIRSLQQGAVDAYTDARMGTGFWSNFAGASDALLGGVANAPKLARTLFSSKTDASQRLRVLEFVGRAALAEDTRPAQEEKRDFGTLFPQADAWIRNPDTEAEKLIPLGRLLQSRKRSLLTRLADGVSSAAERTRYERKINEIDVVQKMIGGLAAYGVDPSKARRSVPVIGTGRADRMIEQGFTKPK